MDAHELRREVAKLNWWHTMDLGHGVVTPGQDRTKEKLKQLHMPRNLRGMSVIDIGAADGFFSFEAERRGAGKVLAIDASRWIESDSSWPKAGFDLARRALASKVESKICSIYDADPAVLGKFDLVLFLGVLYHMQHPLLALERVAAITASPGQLILETAGDMAFHRRAAGAFYAGSELSGDSSNWWGLNYPAIRAMLFTAGFRRVSLVSHRPLLLRVARAVKHRRTFKRPLLETIQHDRFVIHAWK